MALNLDGMTQEEIDAAAAQKNASAKSFAENLKDPAFYKAYQDSVDQRWSDIQNHTNGYESYGDGGFLGILGKVMDPIMNTVIKYGPVVYAAALGGEAMGMFGNGAAAAAGAGEAGAAGLGEIGAGGALSNAGLGLENLGFLDSIGAGAAGTAGAAGLGAVGAVGGADAAAGGLGGMVGVQGGAPAVVSIGAPAAASGGGLGTIVGAGAGLAGLGSVLGGDTLPIDHQALETLPPAESGGVPIAEGDLPPLIIPPLATDPALAAVDPVADGAANIPAGTGGGGIGGIPGLGGLPGSVPSWLQNLLGLGTGLIGGNVDRIKADQDADWWKSQLDTLQGMYKPGTPEATQMEQKMNAMDAASGRNSQYGVRAVNLASNLADKRAGIMTSAGYQNMANAYRGRSSQDLNGLFTALGGASGSGGGLSNLAGLLGSGISGLGSLFGNNAPPR